MALRSVVRLAAAVHVLLGVCGPAVAQVFVPATPATVEWGHYLANAKPAATVHSGDTVRLQTLSTCGPPERLMELGVKTEEIPSYVAPIYREFAARDKGPGSHILTGPVAVVEAEPGDVLEVDILKVDIDASFACNNFFTHGGLLPMEFPYSRSRIVPLDRQRMIARFAPGIEVPLRPFFGAMGVAPAEHSGPPFAHGGNMDNKELVAGTTLYLPVLARGAMFAAGDGHAAQGNGEVDITALETYLTGTFRLVVHKRMPLLWPRAETPEAYVTMGFSTDLKEAAQFALRDMIAFLVEQKHMTRDDAYMLASVAVDMDITQAVDGTLGVHAICPKRIFATAAGLKAMSGK